MNISRSKPQDRCRGIVQSSKIRLRAEEIVEYWEDPSKMIRVNVNGTQRYLPKEMFLIDYLETLKIDVKYVAVAFNGAVLSKDRYNRTLLRDDDNLEIVRPVGGG